VICEKQRTILPQPQGEEAEFIRSARLPEMRARRRASGVCPDGELWGWTREFSVRRERLAEVRRWLDNYQKLGSRASLQELLEKNSFDPAELVMRNRRLVHSSERSKVQTRAVS
jgi:hypothetical protein